MMQTGAECDLLLTGGTVVAMDDERRVLDPGAVAVTGERIVAVGMPQELAGFRPRRTIECRGKAILPGLVNCHNHLFHTLARGLGEGLPLWPWLSEFLWPYAVAMGPEDARAAARLAAVEAARSGITCLVDNHYAPADLPGTLAVAEAIEEVGLRGVVARGILGPPTEVAARHGMRAPFRYSAKEELEITRACIEARPPGSRVSVWPAPQNVTYVDHDLFRESVELARDLGTGWHTNCSESPEDVRIFIEALGVRPVEWLDRGSHLGARHLAGRSRGRARRSDRHGNLPQPRRQPVPGHGGRPTP